MDELVVVQIGKAVVEIALMLFIARAVLWVLFLRSPEAARDNFVVRLCRAGTEPWVRLLRRLAPAVVLDRHLPLAAFGVLLSVWIGLSFAKIALCVEMSDRPACTYLARAHPGSPAPR